MCISKLLTGIFCLIGSAVFSADNANAIVINVSGTTGWTNTGIAINAGDLLQITASGSIRFDSAGRQADPDGQPDGDLILSSGNVVPSVVNHTLVGRIGSSGSLADLSGFLVGSNFSQIVTNSGTLFLGFNDTFVNACRTGLDAGGVGDNSGSFTADVTVSEVEISEPGMLAIFGLGLAGIGCARRKRST